MKIIPLGAFCIVASMLNRNNLRLCSHPFDWLFCDISALKAIISDDFAEFLIPTHLTSQTDANGYEQCMHALYDRNRSDRPFFAHKNPLNAKDRAYYERCIIRFRRDCASGATLIVLEEFGEIDDEFIALSTIITRAYPKCTLKAIRHIVGDVSLDLIDTRYGHELWRFAASHVVDGLRLETMEHESLLLRSVLPQMYKGSS